MALLNKLLIASAATSLMFSVATADDALVKQGEKIFNTKDLGNCLACHDVNGKKIDGPGSFGPKLTGLTHWDDQLLYDTIYDIYAARGLKVTSMPAFGRVGQMSPEEIKAVIAYLKTIQ